mmetsp:Transcript_20898/g.60840  ORF Transcript_20898/g.60840 Transcript_20898/m.60840 type:complete len:231 (+) Transcript_20898:2044-2736(+)
MEMPFAAKLAGLLTIWRMASSVPFKRKGAFPPQQAQIPGIAFLASQDSVARTKMVMQSVSRKDGVGKSFRWEIIAPSKGMVAFSAAMDLSRGHVTSASLDGAIPTAMVMQDVTSTVPTLLPTSFLTCQMVTSAHTTRRVAMFPMTHRTHGRASFVNLAFAARMVMEMLSAAVICGLLPSLGLVKGAPRSRKPALPLRMVLGPGFVMRVNQAGVVPPSMATNPLVCYTAMN